MFAGIVIKEICQSYQGRSLESLFTRRNAAGTLVKPCNVDRYREEYVLDNSAGSLVEVNGSFRTSAIARFGC